MVLTKNNYYSKEANREYWSASFIKEMLDCPARAIAEYSGAYNRGGTSALLIGSFVDAAFEGVDSLSEFTETHPQIFNSRTGELKAEFKKAEDMVKRAVDDPLFTGFMEGQKQRIFTGMIDGVRFKSKLDVYVPGVRIVDLKTVKDFEPLYKEGEGKLEYYDYWNWPLQLAIYQELVFQNTGERLPCYLAVITKQDPPDIDLLQIPQPKLDAEMDYLKMILPELEAQKLGIVPPMRCEKCAYCRKTHKLTEPRIIDILED